MKPTVEPTADRPDPRPPAVAHAPFGTAIGSRSTGVTALRRTASACLAVAVVAAAVSPTGPRAQTSSIPGLVVSTPPSGPGAPPGVVVSPPGPGGMPFPGGVPRAPAPPPQAAPPPQQASADKEQPKPKPKPRTQAKPAPVPIPREESASQGIVALVNDEPITAFEVQELSRFLVLSVNFTDRAKANMKAIAENPKTTERLKQILQETIQANQGKSREQVIAAFEERKKQYVTSLQQQAVASAKASFVPQMRKKALDELIEERLKLQEAKKLNIVIGEDDVERAFKGVAERNNMTSEQFVAHIKSQGADARIMKARFRVSLAWREVIRRKFGHQISVSSREVDRIAAAAGSKSEDAVELQVHKVTVAGTGAADQGALGQRYAEAEAIRQRFQGCKSTQGITKGRANARFEDLGFRRASTFAEPTRSLLLNANEGEMIPPTLTAGGAELYVVCGRRAPKVDETRRQAAENELQMKEFERLAARHLADVRRDALIEMREPGKGG